MDMEKIEFIADKIYVRGPRVDGSYVVTFEVGEYMQPKVAKLLTIPQQTNVKVGVEEEKS